MSNNPNVNRDVLNIFIKGLKKKYPNITQKDMDLRVKNYLDKNKIKPKKYSFCPIINGKCKKSVCMFYSIGARMGKTLIPKAPICLLGRAQ